MSRLWKRVLNPNGLSPWEPKSQQSTSTITCKKQWRQHTLGKHLFLFVFWFVILFIRALPHTILILFFRTMDMEMFFPEVGDFWEGRRQSKQWHKCKVSQSSYHEMIDQGARCRGNDKGEAARECRFGPQLTDLLTNISRWPKQELVIKLQDRI